MLELENKVREAIQLKMTKTKVYDLYAKYEDAYSKLKDPPASVQHRNIDLYFMYLNYMHKRERR